MKILYNLLKVNYKEVRAKERGFHIYNQNTTQLLEKIGNTFLDGYHLALQTNSIVTFFSESENLEKKFQGFFFEGLSMGLAIKDYFGITGKHNLDNLLDTKAMDHIYMINVGIGWANARLPFVDIEREVLKNSDILRALILDGYGFHQAYFKTKTYVNKQKMPKLSREAKHIFYQGVGRCLWFIHGANIGRIAQTIVRFPFEFRGDLWSGIGLAATYAGEISEIEIDKLKMLAGQFEGALKQGVIFAAAARRRADLVENYSVFAVEEFTEMSFNEAAKLPNLLLKKVDKSQNSIKQYQDWRFLIMTHLYHLNKINSSYEEVF